jgi:hypothetical protein
MAGAVGRVAVLLAVIGGVGCDATSATGDAGLGDSAAERSDGSDAFLSDVGACVPCHGTITGPLGNQLADCTQVKDPAPGAIQGAKIDLDVSSQPDGTCMFGGITARCGGDGTFGDGTPLMWSIAGGVVTLQDSTRVFSCKVQ